MTGFNVKIGLIADEFTTTLLKYEHGLELVLIDPDFWRMQLCCHQIDILLVESAWLGVKGKWRKKIACYTDVKPDNTLEKITNYCRKKSIKTVFWNKEDPVHFQRFAHNLAWFDVCLTTEESLVAEYKQRYTQLETVAVMPFFFQPKLHNPKRGEQVNRLAQDIIFCGGLYKQEFPERAERLLMAIDAFKDKEFTVFDRFNQGNNSWAQHKGFKREQAFNYIDSKKYYQSGHTHINVNTCDGSKTMFSRRMLELLACGTRVIDITKHKHKHKGVLSHLTIQANSITDLKKSLDKSAPEIPFDYLEENYSVANFTKKLSHYI